MFDLLKSKLSSFIKSVKNAVSAEPERVVKESARVKEAEERKEEKKPELEIIERTETKVETIPEREFKAEIKPKEETRVEKVVRPIGPPKPDVTKTAEEIEVEVKEIRAKPSLRTRLEGLVMPSITIKEADVREPLEDLELQLIEADVAMPVAQEITTELRSKIVGQKVRYSEFDAFVRRSILDSIRDVMSQERLDLVAFARDAIASGKRPVRLLFVGPNGHGKTTTIAKVAHLLKKNSISCVISASDTFRAAAIEQTAEHGRRLGVPVIRHHYGSDPAAVAFDAIKYAEAHGIDAVLIDTAGRQETSRNLIEQMKKIDRVATPHLRLFVGEGIVGHAIIDQVSQFNEAIRLDGVILTKVDCDTKGGSVISIRKATGVPVLYLTVGQGYDDLVPFDENYILSRIMS